MATRDTDDWEGNRAIVHVDGDAFFASCEVVCRPWLRGKPVVTGKERGIVSACTYEAKALGVTRGMPLALVARQFPQVTILPSDYKTYELFSQRMYRIVSAYAPIVERYSIDECFADVTGMTRTLGCTYPDIAQRLQQELSDALGITFSIGLSVTKTLAKCASKWQKPAGCTVIPPARADTFLARIPIHAVWGIGPRTQAVLLQYGFHTAAAFAHAPEAWVHAAFAKPFFETWQELNGVAVFAVGAGDRYVHASVSRTKTFTPPSTDARFVFAQLSKNVESACRAVRRLGRVTDRVEVFLKTQDFQYQRYMLRLEQATALPQDILRQLRAGVAELWTPHTPYRATGVVLSNLREAPPTQLDLFGAAVRTRSVAQVFSRIDALAQKYGTQSVFLGSSLDPVASKNGREQLSAHRSGKIGSKRLNVPFLGTIS